MLNAQALSELRQSRPMAIDPPAWAAIVEAAAYSGRAEARSRISHHRVGKSTVGVLPLNGLIAYRSWLAEWVGGTNLDEWVAELRTLDNDPAVSSILIDSHSPGGFTDFLPEAAAAVRAASKPTVLLVNPLCASAAYWIGSQCDTILTLRSGEGGSIGVRSGHTSLAGALEKQGVEVTLVASSPQKVEFSAALKLSAEARARLQKGVDDWYSEFKADVLKGRGVTARPEYARLMSSKEMAESRLIDGIVSDPFEASIFAARLGGLSAGKRAAFKREQELCRLENIPAADVAKCALSRVLKDGSYTEPWQVENEKRRRELQRLGVL